MELLNLKNQKNYFYIILILSVFLYFAGLGSTPIYILDEAKNAQCAREMYEKGNWIIPTFNGMLRTDKPPLHYWFMSLGYAIFGINEFGARFFSALAGVGTVLSLYLFTKRFLGLQVAFISCLVFLSSLNLSLEMHYAVPDPYLIFLLSTSLFCVFHFLQTNKAYFLYLFYGLMGLSVLTKGPVAIALPGLLVLAYLILSKQFSFKSIWKLSPIAGLIIVAGVALPWYYMVDKATGGEWTRGFFIEHNLERFTKIKEGHGGFFLITLAFVILGLLPFSVYIFQAHIKAWKARVNPFILFSFLASMSFILFFTVSKTKLPNYTMPCYPFIAILIGAFLKQAGELGLKGLKVPIWILFGIMAVIPVALWFAIEMEPQIKDMKWDSIWFITMPITVAISLRYLYKKNFQKFFLWLSGGFILTSLIFLAIVFPKVYRKNPVYESLKMIDKKYPVVAFRDFNPGYIFYLGKPVPVLETKDQVDSVSNANPHVYILTQERNTDDIANNNFSKIYEGKDIFETPVTKLFWK
ncbi:MAG: phospholipid carrier-dependent glycosyltransferase [Bacteroidetes bacterium]|nr:MAG: phospholipid carrier-dependent glycosyltransferase [Bacteroidota bacterium]